MPPEVKSKISVSQAERWKLAHINESEVPFENLSVYKKKLVLRKEQNYECADCGQNEIWNRNKLVLQLHHIDGDRKNNHRKNLKMLCPNCHSQTSTWQSKNASVKGKIKQKEAMLRANTTKKQMKLVNEIIAEIENSNMVYEHD